MRHANCYIKDYPRPQFVRKSWINLNGKWNFSLDYNNLGEKQGFSKKISQDFSINVPFAYQSELSSIQEKKHCNFVWYSRSVDIKKEKGKKYLLNIEGCDYISKIWVNGTFCGSHTGGYARATYDLTLALKSGSNIIIVKAEDSYSCEQPRGKQRWKDQNYDCWYTDTTGIWKSVWIEIVSDQYLKRVSVRPDYEKNQFCFEVETEGYKKGLTLSLNINYKENKVFSAEYDMIEPYLSINADIRSETADNFKIHLWSNVDPDFYDIVYKLKYNGKIIDEVGSYAAIISYKTKNNTILQNDSCFYLKMLLDQGYWKESGLTPPDEDAIKRDIEFAKEAGFNGIRKHQKLEDERFYYYCDILGISVWCEMPSFYNFTEKSQRAVFSEWMDIIFQVKNHPSIMAWVPINESWGVFRIHSDVQQQQFADALYYMTKSFTNGLIISNDGWDHTISDLVTIHNYQSYGELLTATYNDIDKALSDKKTDLMTYRQVYADNYTYKGQPLILSEFVGISFSNGDNESWGYGDKVKDTTSFIKRYSSLINSVFQNKAFSGFCVTQITDVFQETNGLLTMDRKWKISPEIIAKINEGKYKE